MRRYGIFMSFVLLFLMVFSAQAQDESNFSSTINWFYSACEDRMVVDLHGRMQAGYDIYYQAFDLFGGNGQAITGLRRVSVNGEYSLSQEVNWLGRETRALGTPISVVFRIGRENDPDSAIFQEASDDYLGTCEEPGSTLEAEETLGHQRYYLVIGCLYTGWRIAQSDLLCTARAIGPDRRATKRH